MSGGHFQYINYRIVEILDELNGLIQKNGLKKTKEEIKDEQYPIDWMEKYPEDEYHYEYPEYVINEFKDATEIIVKAGIYIKQIDYLLSGDIGEETFKENLTKELNKDGSR
jgi:hypothetical protein